jgi:hypothetical protein
MSLFQTDRLRPAADEAINRSRCNGPGSPDRRGVREGNRTESEIAVRQLPSVAQSTFANRDVRDDVVAGAPSMTRTYDLQVRNLTLYPTELWAREGEQPTASTAGTPQERPGS